MTETEKAIKAERLRIRRAIAQELRDSKLFLRLCKAGEPTETRISLVHEFTGEILSLRKIAKIIGK